jgi:hypothetical protein
MSLAGEETPGSFAHAHRPDQAQRCRLAEVNVNEVMPAAANGVTVQKLMIQCSVCEKKGIPCKRGKPHMKIVTCAVNTVKQLINRPGVVLISVVRESRDTSTYCLRGSMTHPGNTLISDGLAVILIVLPPPSATLAPSPSYKSMPVLENKFHTVKM